MIDLLAVVAALKERLKTVGLNAYDHVPGSAEWPGAFILPPTVEHEGLGDDLATLTFDVIVLVSGAVDEHQLRLLEFQQPEGPRSIPAAIRAEPTLDGLLGGLRVVRSRPLGYEEQAGYQAYGAAFEIRATAG